MDRKFYFPIDPQTIRIDTVLAFNLLIENSEDEFSIFHKAGKAYSEKSQAQIFEDEITSLFIKDSDKSRYYSYLESNFATIINDPLLISGNKAKIIHQLITIMTLTIYSSPTASAINRYKEVINHVSDYVLKEDDSVKFLIQLTNSSYQLHNHAVNVGIFGMGLTKEMLSGDPSHNIPEIALGLFLHDIGRFTVPKYFNQRNGPLSAEEWKVMKKHPDEGFKILTQFNVMSEEIKVIVLQHHERHNGTGYPSGLHGDQIHTYSKICAISDAFDALTSQRPYRSAQSSFNALAIMQNEMKGDFDPNFFTRFVKLFSK